MSERQEKGHQMVLKIYNPLYCLYFLLRLLSSFLPLLSPSSLSSPHRHLIEPGTILVSPHSSSLLCFPFFSSLHQHLTIWYSPNLPLLILLLSPSFSPLSHYFIFASELGTFLISPYSSSHFPLFTFSSFFPFFSPSFPLPHICLRIWYFPCFPLTHSLIFLPRPFPLSHYLIIS